MKKALLVPDKGHLLEIKKGTYENEKMNTYCKGKWEVVKGKRACVQINGALFLCKKGHFLGA